MKYLLIILFTIPLMSNAADYFINEPISDQTYIDFKSRVSDLSGEKIERLVINSPGGTMFAAMAIGKLLRKNGIDIEVKYFCGSACANYIFLAAKRKFLNENSLVGFHGGMHQENLIDQLKELSEEGSNTIGVLSKEGIASLGDTNTVVLSDLGISKRKASISGYKYIIRYEKNFFKVLNVNPLITYYGQRGIYCDIYKSKKFNGFYYSIESMEKFGVKNIKIISKTWKPETNKLADTAYRIERVNNNLLNSNRLSTCKVDSI